MAGSRRWFPYTADNGNQYAILADESNTELVNLLADYQGSVAGLEPLPKGVTARFVTLANVSNTISRDCYILTPERYGALNNATNFLLTASNFSGVATDTPTSIVLKQPEISRRQPRQGDTGLVDGDID